ncbi:hypothetical protein BOTBODRAFT_38594 [Botryobasidium botryosum FD-172 SS1]|uniref:rRNA-processing protein n=1 Tax=Botryobasidium botryosum (strain FD-172 SS1) TaxID=930990 RepID=A0A067LZ88_BOTB1|nr:hypothetical protein BOTBODRAFT_38594 [Botryobasidium botryosum FD-172 SS1]
MESVPTTSCPAPTPVDLRATSAGRTSGKNWKLQKSATKRSHLPEGVRTKSWEERMAKTTREAAIKKLEKEMKEEKQAEADRKRQAILDRRKAKEERERLELMKAKMSAKKLQRMRRKAGRTKKING